MVAELGGERGDPVPVLGRPQNAPDRREGLVSEGPDGRGVGGDHEVFDELLGPVRRLRPEIHEGIAVEERLRLGGLQAQCSVDMPEAPHRLGDPILDPQLVVEPRHREDARRGGRRTVEPGRDGVVRELGAIDHDGAVDLRLFHAAVGRDQHLGHDGETFFPLPEGREVGGQLGRQHRKDLRRRVHGGRVRLRVAVDGGPPLHGGVDVGDGDVDPHVSARRRRTDRELIQVARGVVVDRRPEQSPQIANVGALRHWSDGDGVGLRQNGLREVREQATLSHGAACDRSELVHRDLDVARCSGRPEMGCAAARLYHEPPIERRVN